MTDQKTIDETDWGDRAQKAAEQHILACWAHHHAVEEHGHDAEALVALGDDPAIGPFCGCTTCEVREILTVAMPHIAEGIILGQIDPYDMLTAEQAARLRPNQEKTDD